MVESSKRIYTKYPLDRICIESSHAVVFCLRIMWLDQTGIRKLTKLKGTVIILLLVVPGVE